MQALMMTVLLAQPAELPDAQQVVEAAIATMTESRARMEALGVTYRKEVEKFDTSVEPRVLKEQAMWLMWYHEGSSYQQLIERNGEPVPDAAVERVTKDAFDELPDRFEYSWNSEPIIESFGVRLYVIDIRPKKDAGKGFKSPQEKTLARMEGKLYVNIDGMFIQGLVAELPESFRPIWPVLKVNSSFFVFRQAQVPLYRNGTEETIVVFDGAAAEFSVAFFGKQRDELHRYTYFGYQMFEDMPDTENTPPAR
ncbi:MAG: hypothetical protein R3284_12340 [Rubricoccaceae bacterium]|nr:hypothetical protein [Rubricoccaceae bacterium]